MINIIDDALDAPLFEKIQETFLGDACPWFFSKGVARQDDGDFQFVHGIYSGSEPASNYWPLVRPILHALNAASVMNIKANLLVRTESIVELGMHVDNPLKDAYTAVYYINTNNGYTFFENGTKCESVANRLVAFPSHMQHGGTTCTDQPTRMLINFNYHPIIENV